MEFLAVAMRGDCRAVLSDSRRRKKELLRSNSGEASMVWFVRREELGDSITDTPPGRARCRLVALKIEKYEESRNDKRDTSRFVVPRSDTRNTKELTQTQATSAPIDIPAALTLPLPVS